MTQIAPAVSNNSAATTVPNPPSPSKEDADNALPPRAKQFLAVFNETYLSATGEAVAHAERVVAVAHLLVMLCHSKNQQFLAQLGEELTQEIQEATYKLVCELPVVEWFAEVCQIATPDPVRTTFAPAQATSNPAEADAAVALTEVSVTPAPRPAPASVSAGAPVGEAVSPKRWTRASVLALVNEPIPADVYSRIMGSKRTHPHYLATNQRVPKLLALLGARGPLTVYQLTAFLTGRASRAYGKLPPTRLTNVRRLLLLMEFKQLVVGQLADSPSQMKLWKLDRPGEIYHAMLEGGGVTAASDPVTEAQSGHAFGTTQVLAALVSASGAVNAIGLSEHVAHTVREQLGLGVGQPVESETQEKLPIPALPRLGLYQWARQVKPAQTELIEPAYGCGVELAGRNEKLVVLAGSDEYNRPDGMGRIAYEGRWGVPTALAAAGYAPDSSEEGANFVFSNFTSRRYWPFILEYDRATENYKDYEKKARDYAKIYNTLSTEWPPHWGGQFPTILVVTEGGPGFMLSLRSQIATTLLELQRTHAVDRLSYNWWFTSVEWFRAVFGPYLDVEKLGAWYNYLYPNLLRSEAVTAMRAARRNRHSAATVTDGKGDSDEPQPSLILGPTPRIWLPLLTKTDKSELMELDNYIQAFGAGQVVRVKADGTLLVRGGGLPTPPALVKRLRALPLLMPLNQVG